MHGQCVFCSAPDVLTVNAPDRILSVAPYVHGKPCSVCTVSAPDRMLCLVAQYVHGKPCSALRRPGSGTDNLIECSVNEIHIASDVMSQCVCC